MLVVDLAVVEAVGPHSTRLEGSTKLAIELKPCPVQWYLWTLLDEKLVAGGQVLFEASLSFRIKLVQCVAVTYRSHWPAEGR